MDSGDVNVKMVIQYDGTRFCGFQRQKQGERTVQDTLEGALAELTGGPIKTDGAGRTDSGVHALGQVVSFRSGARVPAERIARALRRYLPDDLQAVSSEAVEADFHARFSAKGKEYQYTIYQAEAPIPTLRRYALYVPGRLDVDEMRRALSFMEGTRDFSALGNEGTSKGNPVKTIFSAQVEVKGRLIIFRVHGSGFLYRMVRNIVGTALEVGRGKESADWIPGLLDRGDRSAAGPAIGPQGLCLMKVDYE